MGETAGPAHPTLASPINLVIFGRYKNDVDFQTIIGERLAFRNDLVPF